MESGGEWRSIKDQTGNGLSKPNAATPKYCVKAKCRSKITEEKQRAKLELRELSSEGLVVASSFH